MEHTTVASLLRSTQALCLQLCRKQTLDYGIAYYSERFAALPDANQFREVVIDDPGRIPDAFARAQAWFAGRNLNCHRWATAGGGADETLTTFLASRGYYRRALTAMAMAHWREIPCARDVRIAPGRALREVLRRTFLDDDTPPTMMIRDLLAESCNERMDDPQLDMFVATIDRNPAGRIALHQVGDIARLADLSVLPAFVDRGVEQSLLSHALALARRLALSRVVAQVSEDATLLRDCLLEAGFVEDGQIVEFELSAPLETVGTK